MPKQEAADRDLLAAASAGDQRAFRALYARHAGVVYRFALRFAPTPQDAEEILSECFVAALDAPDAPRCVRAYLMTAARNKGLNRRRDGARRARLLAHHEDSALRATTASAGERDAPARERALAAVEERARTLVAPQARLFALKAGGASDADIARELAIPKGTVKSRWHHLVRLLRKEIEGWTAD